MSDEQQRQAEIRAKCFHPTGQWEEFKPEDLNQSIVSRFEQMVARYPDRLAIKANDEQITYAELNRAANQLAHTIVAQYGYGAEPVLTLLDNSIQSIVAIIGILKAGKFYVMLDTTHPQMRLESIVEELRAVAFITNTRNLMLAERIAAHIQIINLDDQHQQPDRNLNLTILPSSYAYIIFISGSTGIPKGVLGDHAAILHGVAFFVNLHRLCSQDRVGLAQSVSFGFSTVRVYQALLCGAALCITTFASENMNLLAQWLAEDQITYFTCVPSIFRGFAQNIGQQMTLPNLRILGLAGDRVLASDIEIYQKKFTTNTVFRVSYGLSEIILVSSYLIDYQTVLASQVVPIGYTAPGVDVFLINDDGHRVRSGEIGEIVIKSRYLSPGYWQQPELTKARFQADPNGSADRLYFTGDLGMMQADGYLIHMGRKDQQVKIAGVRIEVAEVELALWRTGWFKETIVMARPDQSGEPVLVAYLVARLNPAPTVSALRQILSAKLPAQMLPSAFVFLQALPQTPNHKIDIKALPAPSTLRPMLDMAYQAPRNELEEKLATIWHEVLDISPIGIHDHFLDLGGNSLRAAQVISRILKTFQVSISQQILLAQPTIAKMVLTIVQHQAELVDSQSLELWLQELENGN